MVFGFEAVAIAQGSSIVVNDEKCAGRIYEPKEVSLPQEVVLSVRKADE
jgi:hypothetical protein